MNKRKMPRWVWTASAIFVAIATILVCGVLWAQQQPYNSMAKKTLTTVTNTTKSATQKITGNDPNETADRDKIKSEVMAQDAKGYNLTKQGYVAIPDMGIFLPIYDNAYSATALNLGANTAQKSGQSVPVMGEKNYPLAAHNWDNGYTGFSALQQQVGINAPYLVSGHPGTNDWLNGKKIYLANGSGIYTYTVTGQETVNENDASSLNTDLSMDGHPEITIMTCLFPNTHWRIVTLGKFTSFTEWSKTSAKEANYFNTDLVKTNIRP